MLVVVAYDVSNDRRRTRLHQRLKSFGHAVQYSIFECHLNPRQFQELQAMVKRTINTKSDLVRYYRLCEPCHGNIIAINGPTTTLDDTVIV
jgi:CRISPR-associated protein Cas2